MQDKKKGGNLIVTAFFFVPCLLFHVLCKNVSTRFFFFRRMCLRDNTNKRF